MAGDIPLEKDTGEVHKKEVLTPIDPTWNDTVTAEGVRDMWISYMRTIQDKNSRLASIMTNHKPELKDGTVLYVKLKNVTQQSELNTEKPALFHYLKTQLRNAKLTLETVVLESDKHTKKAFTAAERAKVLAEKNPNLLLLTKNFDLDVEL